MKRYLLRAALALLVAAGAGRAQDSPSPSGDSPRRRPGLRDLQMQYSRAIEGVPGMRTSARFRYLPHNGGANGEGTAEVFIWLQDSEDRSRRLMFAEERPAERISIRTLLTPNEATILYVQDRLAYVYALERPANIPWQWFLLYGPGPETNRHFEIRITRFPDQFVPGAPLAEDPATAGGQAHGMDLAGNARPAEFTFADPHAEDAWILSLVPRHRALRDEIPSLTAWLRPDQPLPYRIIVDTALEALHIDLGPYQPLAEFPEAAFALDLTNAQVRYR